MHIYISLPFSPVLEWYQSVALIQTLIVSLLYTVCLNDGFYKA